MQTDIMTYDKLKILDEVIIMLICMPDILKNVTLNELPGRSILQTL